MSNFRNHFNYFAFLLFFIFGGAIVGETVALTMAVSILGPSIVGKLYLINGIILLLLPTFFFRNIDKINRGKLLSGQLLATTGVLFVYLFIFILFNSHGLESKAVKILILIIYPLSYLSKTILFLTFWILANDLYTSNESKKAFPKIAAWGFVGGLSGACSARLLLVKVDSVMIIGLWSLAYFIGWLLCRKITEMHKTRLLNKEDTLSGKKDQNFFKDIQGVLESKLIRSIAALYFFVFITIFLQDYLFWKTSSFLFSSTNSLASFQYTFYLTHGFLTIVGLRFIMPSAINKWGFQRIFSLLPITLFAGAVLLSYCHFAKVGDAAFFMVFTVIQFFRYVVFENAFSPIYQMFFAVVPKEKRGRAKTFLEGIIKPISIISSGVILIPADRFHGEIPIIIGLFSAVMIYIVSKLRNAYREALLPHYLMIDSSEDIISKIGSFRDQKIISIVREYSHSKDSDMRSLAIKILAHDGSRQAFKIICDIFSSERNQAVRETIARSLNRFPSFDSRSFARKLISDANPRIRANVLFSLSEMDSQWLVGLRDIVRIMLFDTNPRIQIEASRFLWRHGDDEDRKNVFSIIDSLYASKNLNKLSAGVYLVGILKPPKWELLLLRYLQSTPLQVFAKCVEIIFKSGTKEARLKTFSIAEDLSRKHISIIGKTLVMIGIPAFDAVGEYLRIAHNQRMIVEVIHALRGVIEAGKLKNETFTIDKETRIIIMEWIFKDLESVYRDSFVWYYFCKHTTDNPNTYALTVFEDALHDQLFRLCERILDVMVLLDEKGTIAAICKDFDLKDYGQRLQVAEIIESFGDTAMTAVALPILRSDEWGDIAKIARNHFHFAYDIVTEGIFYFIRSKNKWLCFCALYYLHAMHCDGEKLQLGNELLRTLKEDGNRYLSSAASRFLPDEAEQSDRMIEPFELLERVMSLKKTVLFRHVSAEKLMELAEITQCMSYKNGTLISREGEVSDHLYIISKGSLRIVKAKNNVKTVLSILHAGETYGEIGLFNQAPRFASAIADEDCELWVIQRSALKKFLLDMPEIAYNFLEVFSDKLRRNSEEVVHLNTLVSSSKKDYL